jgi:hypothetical protein
MHDAVYRFPKITLARTWVNKAKKRAEAATPRPFSLIGALSVSRQTRRHRDERSREAKYRRWRSPWSQSSSGGGLGTVVPSGVNT